MPLDYETLKIIWWLLLGVLLIGFALTDGFDMGIGTLLPFIGRNDDERRVIINSYSRCGFMMFTLTFGLGGKCSVHDSKVFDVILDQGSAGVRIKQICHEVCLPLALP